MSVKTPGPTSPSPVINSNVKKDWKGGMHKGMTVEAALAAKHTKKTYPVSSTKK